MAYRAPILLGERHCHCERYHRHCCRRCWLSQHKFHNLYFRRLCSRIRSCVVYIFYHYYYYYFFSFRSCRGSLNRSMRCTRSTSYAICRFVSSISYARARSLSRSSKITGMRWHGCATVSYYGTVLSLLFSVEQRSLVHSFSWWGSLTDDFGIVADSVAVSHADSSGRARTQFYKFEPRRLRDGRTHAGKIYILY